MTRAAASVPIGSMETAAQFTQRRIREEQFDYALYSIDSEGFDKRKPRRFITGIAVSSSARNTRGNSIHAAGMQFSLPSPLLWNHDWCRPFGKITSVEIRGETIRIHAEVASALPWHDQIWGEVVDGNVAGLSVCVIPLTDRVVNNVYRHWSLEECSAVQFPADENALITKCWEHDRVVYWNRSSTSVWWDRTDPAQPISYGTAQPKAP